MLDAVQCPLVSAALQDEVGEVVFFFLSGQSLLLVFSGWLGIIRMVNLFRASVCYVVRTPNQNQSAAIDPSDAKNCP